MRHSFPSSIVFRDQESPGYKYPGDSSSLKIKALCPVCATASRSVSSSTLSDMGKLQSHTLHQSRFKTAANQPSQSCVAAQVRAARTRLQSLPRYSIFSSRVETYRVLPASPSSLPRCASLTLMMGLHSAWISPARNPSSPRNFKCMSSTDFPSSC